jgi:hypothetical protein
VREARFEGGKFEERPQKKKTKVRKRLFVKRERQRGKTEALLFWETTVERREGWREESGGRFRGRWGSCWRGEFKRNLPPYSQKERV